MFELPSPFETQPGVVRLLEPPGSDAAALREQLVAGRYGKPFVIENVMGGSGPVIARGPRPETRTVRHRGPSDDRRRR